MAGSFALAGALGGLGITALARNTSPAHRMFAAIPLVFAVQQASEGVVWLTMGGPQSFGRQFSIHTFLIVALTIWPLWLPFSLFLLERNPVRQKILRFMAYFGLALAIYSTWFLVRWHPTARVAGHSVQYQYGSDATYATGVFYMAAYVIPTMLPLFVSTMKLARPIAFAFVGSFAVAFMVQRQALTSVWCFFAALLSLLLLVSLQQEKSLRLSEGPTSAVS